MTSESVATAYLDAVVARDYAETRSLLDDFVHAEAGKRILEQHVC